MIEVIFPLLRPVRLLLLSVALFDLKEVKAADSGESLAFPTGNTALLQSRPEAFFMGVTREGATAWEGGSFGFVRSPFSWRGETLYTQFHEGIDIAPVERDPAGNPLDAVKAAAAGTVVFRGEKERTGYGVQVLLRHDWPCGPVFTRYAHLSEAQVQAGESAARGGVLGRLGHSGGGIPAARAHLHFELNLMLNETADPAPLHIPPDAGDPRFHRRNFAGVDAAALLKRPGVNAADAFAEHVKSLGVCFTVEAACASPAVPDILKRHPWLLRNPTDTGTASGETVAARGWRIHFTEWGLPAGFEPLENPPVEPRVSQVRDFPNEGQHSWRTGGLLSGTGSAAVLSAGGRLHVQWILAPPGSAGAAGK